ncbi:hypothetical protein [Streptomyces albidus (ex Kaewkla and Franco 2022)]|uniref:hypothetical protein n=1 Tax=Streptomyces albidus (ex Kaewkla and Franco 2022) TaxID=722709 RepID=UPI0015EE530D|nr:hypothetical protein [Streptomyces albidus (ex Kaewkla and Franco 2022)]
MERRKDETFMTLLPHLDSHGIEATVVPTSVVTTNRPALHPQLHARVPAGDLGGGGAGQQVSLGVRGHLHADGIARAITSERRSGRPAGHPAPGPKT